MAKKRTTKRSRAKVAKVGTAPARTKAPARPRSVAGKVKRVRLPAHGDADPPAYYPVTTTDEECEERFKAARGIIASDHPFEVMVVDAPPTADAQ